MGYQQKYRGQHSCLAVLGLEVFGSCEVNASKTLAKPKPKPKPKGLS